VLGATYGKLVTGLDNAVLEPEVKINCYIGLQKETTILKSFKLAI